MRTWRTGLLLALSLGLGAPSLGGTPSEEQERSRGLSPDYSDQIIWSYQDPSAAFFIPEKVLRAEPLERLPLPTHSLERLQTLVRISREWQAGGEEACVYETGPGGPYLPKDRLTIDEYLDTTSVVFVGTVLQSVVGWFTPPHGRPVRMHYVQVDEVLRSNHEGVWEGAVVAFSEDQATLEIQGVDVCSRLPDGYKSPETGERVLVGGSNYAGHPYYLDAHIAFPVRKGKVIPQPRAILEAAEAPSLESLRLQMKPGGGR